MIIYYNFFVADSTIVASGSPQGRTGLTPTFLELVTTGPTQVSVISHATITEVVGSGGNYQVAYDAELYGEASGVIDCTSALAINSDRFLPIAFARDSSRVQAGFNATGDVVLASNGLDGITIESGVNARQALSPILAASAGVVSGAGTGVIVIRGGNSSITRITAATDTAGDRTSVTLSLPT